MSDTVHHFCKCAPTGAKKYEHFKQLLDIANWHKEDDSESDRDNRLEMWGIARTIILQVAALFFMYITKNISH